MALKKHWTLVEDANLRIWCSQGISWTDQGLRFGVHRDTVVFRARRLGVKLAKVAVAPVEEKMIPRTLSGTSGGDAWDALPVGHPISWGALTRGTWLEGTRYPTAQ